MYIDVGTEATAYAHSADTIRYDRVDETSSGVVNSDYHRWG